MKNLFVIYAPKEPRLTNEAINKISDICIGVGHISFGSVVVPFAIDKTDPLYVIVGSVAALIFYFLGVWLTYKYYE